MKFVGTLFFLGNCLFVQSQTNKDSVPTNNKEQFYKNYADYLIKSKTNTPKQTIDSSTFYARPVNTSKTNSVKSTLPAQELKGTISAKDKSVELAPGKPLPTTKVVAVDKPSKDIKPNAAVPSVKSETPKQVKFNFDTIQPKVSKITVDSSVFFNKSSITKNSQPTKKGTTGVELTGTILPETAKSKKVIQTTVEPPKTVAITNNKQQNSIPPQVKFVFDTTKPKVSKVTVDSSVFYTKKINSKIYPTVETNLQAQELSGTLVPDKKNKGKLVAPVGNEPIKATSNSDAKNTTSKKYILPPAVIAKNPSETIDTTLITSSKEVATVATDFKAQEFKKGTILPSKNNPLVIAPTTNDGILYDTKTKPKETLPTIEKNTTYDLEKTKLSDPLSVYGAPPASEGKGFSHSVTSTSSYTVEGYTSPKRSNYEDSMVKNYGVPGIIPTASENSMAALVSPYEDSLMQKYTVPNPKINYKSQVLYKELIAGKKDAKILEPISADSIARKAMEDSLIAVAADSLRKMNEEAMRTAEQERQREIVASTQDPSQNTKYNFYVVKSGTFTVSFSTNNFYVNVNQQGKIIDFALMSNGSVTAGSLKNRVTQVGNAKVVYNYRGNIDSIAGIQITYTYDGKVNKVGNSFIDYNYEGVIDKVADIPIIYNGNSTIHKFGNFAVTYNNQAQVVGIDDSSGLIIFKPMGDK
jgi:hypothetical protein